MLNHLIPNAASASRQVATRSVLNPLLWLSLIVWVPALAAAGFVPSPFNYIALAIGVLTVVVALGMYVYFAVSDPDRLQDEEYLLQQQMVARMGDNLSNEEFALPAIDGATLTANTSVEGNNG